MTTPALRHDALLYASEQEFIDALEPFVRGGLRDGEAVVAVTTETNVEHLRAALGPEASQVSFIDARAWYRHPARTIAGYRRTLDARLAAGCERIRVIGEVQFGDTHDEQRDWVRYEAALNRAFAASPAWIVCPYDERILPRSVLSQAARTHPHLLHRGKRQHSSTYQEPETVARELTGQPSRPAGRLLCELDLNGDLAPARRALHHAAVRGGLAPEASDRLTVAVNEALTNAVVHGRPPVHLRVYGDESSVTCEVSDAGGGLADPLAGYMPPGDHPEDGMGLWLARQLCDRVEVLAADDWPVVRMTMKKLG